jgi:hypothetical protein
MKRQVYKHHSVRDFEVGDWVFLKLQPYKYMSINQKNKENKLAPKYYGPLQGICKGLEVWLTNWSFLHLHMYIQSSMFIP